MNIIKIILNLDVFDLDYIYSNEKVNVLSYLTKSSLPKKGLVLRILAYIKKTVLSFIEMFKTTFEVKAKHIVFFANTRNQSIAINPLYNEFADKSIYFGLNGFGKVTFPSFLAYVISYFCIPIYMYRIWKSSRYIRTTLSYYFDKYLFNYGYFVIWYYLLKIINPKLIVLANDHVGFTRTLLKLSKIQKIKTIYIQHASVTNFFPPLDFEYAFLDGLDSVNKYCDFINKSETIVYLTGNSKITSYEVKAKDSNKAVGVCLSLLDKLEVVEDILSSLVKNCNTQVFLRCHPSESRMLLFKEMCDRFEIELSDSKLESPIDFLKRVDIIIAGDTSIHLEAALMSVIPVYYPIGDEAIKDFYGYIDKKLITNQPESITDLIITINLLFKKKYFFDEKIIQYYHATYATKYFTKEKLLMVNIINTILEEEKKEIINWEETYYKNKMLVKKIAG